MCEFSVRSRTLADVKCVLELPRHIALQRGEYPVLLQNSRAPARSVVFSSSGTSVSGSRHFRPAHGGGHEEGESRGVSCLE